MKEDNGTWKNRAFVLAFLALTLFCWCPLGYGSYGPVPRFFGIPSWAALALTLGGVLFLVEWIYLFRTKLAMNDEELSDIISQLKSVDTGNSALGKPNSGKEAE